MIPRRRTVSPRADPVVPADAPMAEHRALDLDIQLDTGVLSITINEGDELIDTDPAQITIRYVSGEVVTIPYQHVRWISRRERTWQTLPEAFTPPEATD